MMRHDPILASLLLSGLLLAAFLAGRAPMPTLPADVSAHIATLEAQLAKERADNAVLEGRLAHAEELTLDRLAEMEAGER